LFISKDVRGLIFFDVLYVSANTPPEKPIEDSRKHA
jgi:hypothetical protein